MTKKRLLARHRLEPTTLRRAYGAVFAAPIECLLVEITILTPRCSLFLP